MLLTEAMGVGIKINHIMCIRNVTIFKQCIMDLYENKLNWTYISLYLKSIKVLRIRSLQKEITDICIFTYICQFG